eukprot:4173643-Prymnesium_polylepis.1
MQSWILRTSARRHGGSRPAAEPAAGRPEAQRALRAQGRAGVGLLGSFQDGAAPAAVHSWEY